MENINYWESRYVSGGNSGAGSYGCLLDFKAQVLNCFIRDNGITSVQDFGCGDGSLLRDLRLDGIQYYGYDISNFVLDKLKEEFKDKAFIHLDDYQNLTSDLVISIDVIFHLVNQESYEKYIQLIQRATTKFLIVYSSNIDDMGVFGNHIKHHMFVPDIKMDLVGKIQNHYPFFKFGEKGSFCDFYIFQK